MHTLDEMAPRELGRVVGQHVDLDAPLAEVGRRTPRPSSARPSTIAAASVEDMECAGGLVPAVLEPIAASAGSQYDVLPGGPAIGADRRQDAESQGLIVLGVAVMIPLFMGDGRLQCPTAQPPPHRQRPDGG
ncbi:hypothetical protein AB0H36_39875 [Kribbella sp. NPDC050820]|uniref:hypothetical protein n=1 Tax=Kribbella sp. NPDC050820 TaxID=3155408 RepID=UPI00340FBF76